MKQSWAFFAGAANAVGSNNLLGAGRMNPSDLPPEVQTSARVGQVVGDIFSIGQGFIEGAAGASLTGTAMAGSPLAVAASGPTLGGSAAVDAGMGLVGIGVMVHAATVVVTAAVNGADNFIALSEGNGNGGNSGSGKIESDFSPDINPKDLAGKTPDEIHELAIEKGLTPKGSDPKNGRGSYVDPVTGEQRVLIHEDHIHVNNPSGQRLDIDGNPVPNRSAEEVHLPLNRPQRN